MTDLSLCAGADVSHPVPLHYMEACSRHLGLLSPCLQSHCSFCPGGSPEPSACIRPCPPLSTCLRAQAVIVPTLLKRKLRVREVRSLAQGHKVNLWQGQIWTQAIWFQPPWMWPQHPASTAGMLWKHAHWSLTKVRVPVRHYWERSWTPLHRSMGPAITTLMQAPAY